jgi:hypothetical protein
MPGSDMSEHEGVGERDDGTKGDDYAENDTEVDNDDIGSDDEPVYSLADIGFSSQRIRYYENIYVINS